MTTPIYYVNAKPHIGTAYTTLVADVIARYKRLKGFDVFFLTGTDEHGSKIQREAEKAGKSPKEFCDEMAEKFKEVWKELDISYDYFVRTTDSSHEKTVQEFFQKLFDQEDIYLGEYEGWYCVPCETFYPESKLAKGNCPGCGRTVEKMKETTYFFKLSKYLPQVKKFIASNPYSIQPSFRRTEMLNIIDKELEDLSVSRTNISWGIPCPFDSKHVIYVWFDALLNYLSAIGWPHDMNKFEKYWPADIHLVGKDILKFHTIIWPAMLLAAGIEPPRTVFGHGWWTVRDQKISKSKGNVVNPLELKEKYGLDAVKYFLLRETPFGLDGDYSEDLLRQRYDSELANDLGNLVNRTTIMIEKYCEGKVPKSWKRKPNIDKPLAELALETAEEADELYSKNEFHKALSEIWKLINACNKYINDTKPWDVWLRDKARIATIMYTLSECIRIISVLIAPVLVESSKKIREQFSLPEKFDFASAKEFDLIPAGTLVSKGELLFRKLDKDLVKEAEQKKVRDVGLSVGPELKKLGVNVFMISFSGLRVKKKHMGLEKLKKQVAEELKEISLENNSVLQGYDKLNQCLGLTGFTSAPRHLIELIKEKGMLPNINTVVDCYNIVAAKRFLSCGAHDISMIKGNVIFKVLDGSEKFTPLDENKVISLPAGEYGCVDEEKVLCRMDVKQCNQTKITHNTTDVMVYVQGNSATSEEYLRQAAQEIAELIQKFCGGNYSIKFA